MVHLFSSSLAREIETRSKSTLYWIFGSTVERPRRPSAMLASTGSDVITRSGNATAHAPEAFTETVLDLLQHLSISERNRDLDFGPDNDDVLDFSDYDLGDDFEPERSRASLAPVKMMCKLDWPSVSYRKTWTYAFLVLDQSAPCVLEHSLSHYYRLVRVPRAGSVRATRRHRHLQRSARLSHARAQPQQAEGRCSAHAQTYRRRQDGPGRPAVTSPPAQLGWSGQSCWKKPTVTFPTADVAGTVPSLAMNL